MTQNQMVNFITLTDLDANKVELNPAFIVLMKRDTYEPEQGVEMPFTKIFLTTNHNLYALETPEQIAQLQLDAASKVMTAIMSMTTQVMNQLEEEDY